MLRANAETRDALLMALRERAIARNCVRNEMRANSKAGVVVDNPKLVSWRAYQKAEATLSAALLAWELAEGVGDP